MLKQIAIFVAGAGIGSLVTWNLVKSKYEQMAQEEINAMREHYREKEDKALEEAKTKSAINRNKPDIREYEKTVSKYNYNACSKTEAEEKEEPEQPDVDSDNPIPYTINPDEYEYGLYTKVMLMYYADEVLATDDTDEILDPDECIGADALNKFGEWEEDVVYVRNDKQKIDYEVCRSLSNYADIVGFPQ